MQVSIYSRADLESLSQEGIPYDTAVICFYERNKGSMDLPLHIDSYQVAMNDTEPEELFLFELAEKTFFSEADVLAHFIFYAKTAGLKIICVCETGVCRSAGCAAAIRQFFDRDGIEVFASYDYSPNRLVYHRILNALIEEQAETGGAVQSYYCA